MAARSNLSETQLNEMLAIGDLHGEYTLAQKIVQRGGTLADFYRALADRPQLPDAETLLGLSPKDVQNYSITRIARSMANGKPQEARHEKELSALLMSKTGIVPNGEAIPFAVMAMGRDFNAGATGEAGNLIGSARTGDYVGDPLRKVFSLAALGAQFLTGLSSTVTYPVFAQGTDAAFMTEIGSATAITGSTRAVVLTPRRLAVQFAMSRQANLQSDAQLDSIVPRQLKAAIDEGMLRGILAGDGTGQNPTGILNDSNVNVIVGGATGATLTFQHLVDMENSPAAANVAAGNGAWIINSATAKYLRTKAAGTNLPFIYGNDGCILGQPVVVNNLLPANLTKSSGTNLSGLVYSPAWQELIVGIYGAGFDLTIDPYSLAPEGKIRVIVSLTFGFGLRQPLGFSVMKDAALV